MNKILVFTTSFNRFTKNDTTPPFVFELSKRLQQKGLEVIVLTPKVPGTKKFELQNNMKIYRYSYFFTEKLETLNDGAILSNLKKNKLLYFQVPFLIIFGMINLIKIIKKEKITTIHAHWIIPGGFLAVIYKKLINKNIKIACTTHGGDIFGLRGKIGTFIKKYTLKHIDTLTVVSNAIKKECIHLGIQEKKIHVISMGVDDKLFSPNNYDKTIKDKYNVSGKLLLFVGRFAEKKGVRYLIDAMQKILKIYPDSKLLLIGFGPLEKELKNQVKILNLNENIIFVGAIENQNLANYYATADVFIGPSIIAKDGDSEGFGLVFVEAILSGTITIGSNIYGITDIIQNGKTGFLVEEKNSDDIVEKVKYIFENDDFDIDNARKIIKEKFSWDVIGEKYFNLLNE